MIYAKDSRSIFLFLVYTTFLMDVHCTLNILAMSNGPSSAAVQVGMPQIGTVDVAVIEEAASP